MSQKPGSAGSEPHVGSAWPSHPEYRIDLLPWRFRARAWAGEQLLADTSRALRVEETDHTSILYFPLEDIRLDLMSRSDHHTICPFKGRADYWSADSPDGENVLWTYPDPFPEVAGIAGHGAFYHDRVRVELVEPATGSDPPVVTRFPSWGDVEDLIELLDVREEGPGRFLSVGRRDPRRGVVEGSQLLAQSIVAAAKHAPDRRVVSAHMQFSRPADPEVPVELDLDTLTHGRTFSSIEVRIRQGGRLCAPGLLLLDTGAPSVIDHHAPMPDVPGPLESSAYDMSVTGRALRIVNHAYSPDPEEVGPPELDAWLRYRKVPDLAYLHDALVAQFSGHLAIAAALRPHRGFGESQAHCTLSTAITAITLTLHRPIRATEWMLFSHRSTSAGAGMTHAECRVYTEAGDLVASFTVEAMVRSPRPDAMERSERTVL